MDARTSVIFPFSTKISFLGKFDEKVISKMTVFYIEKKDYEL